MSIGTDIDVAIDAAQGRGIGLAAMKLNMGVGALRALMADAHLESMTIMNGFPIAYRNIPIDHIEPPAASLDQCKHHFHGWELIA